MLKPALVTLVLCLTIGFSSAQEVKPASKEATDKAAAAVARRDPAQPINIKLDFVITDESAPGETVKRNVAMIVADQQSGAIRSSGRVHLEGKGSFDVSLNVDATPRIVDANKIRLTLTLDYAPMPGTENAATGEGRSRVNERLGLIVESGKPMLISQASDPTSNRKISVELVATVLR